RRRKGRLRMTPPLPTLEGREKTGERTMRPWKSPLIPFLAVAVFASAPLAAQDALVPCKDSTCTLKIDWGGSKTSADYPPDKRYGSGDDFEQRFRNALREKGFRFVDAGGETALSMIARPTMQKNVMCDAMAGINTDRT